MDRATRSRRSRRALAVVAAGLLGLGIIGACAPFGVTLDHPDASTQVDAAPDVVLSAFCKAQAGTDILFCDSFDVNGIAEWIQHDRDPTTEYGVEETRSVSPPASGRCTIRPGNPDSQDARLDRVIPGAYSWVELSGMARVSGGKQALQFARIVFGGLTLLLFVTGETRWRADAGGIVLFAVDPLPRETFVPFSLRVDLRTKDVRSTLGTLTKGDRLEALSSNPSSLTLGIGPAESNTDAGWSILYDNIVVRGGP